MMNPSRSAAVYLLLGVQRGKDFVLWCKLNEKARFLSLTRSAFFCLSKIFLSIPSHQTLCLSSCSISRKTPAVRFTIKINWCLSNAVMGGGRKKRFWIWQWLYSIDHENTAHLQNELLCHDLLYTQTSFEEEKTIFHIAFHNWRKCNSQKKSLTLRNRYFRWNFFLCKHFS